MPNAAASSQKDTAEKVLGSGLFVIAQRLATGREQEEAVAELESLRPVLCDAFGAESTQVRNLDKQISRLRSALP